ncbi:hypothetical protein [Kiloniella sp. EL199]|uniref:hypothetical protein n=1 Tax=Kiloniella sp. EL199 TaxID=2107581 RepID=UPI000EA3511F|nr:hypothetical protein [Kiloniella sp. EL199]
MPRHNRQIARQDKQSIAALSIFALCLKMLLPIAASFFISHQATASVSNTAFDKQTSLEKSLSFICTPGGIFVDQDSKSSSMDLADHCDFCLTSAFVTIHRDTNNLETYTLLESSLSWQIIGSKQTRLLFDGHRHSSRAPPRA